MNKYRIVYAGLAAVVLLACNQPQKQQQKQNPAPVTQPAPVKTPPKDTTATENVLTLPALDALFYEKDFGASLKSELGLSALQINKLRSAAHNSLAQLSEEGTADTASASAASKQYEDKIAEVIGPDKAKQLDSLVAKRYSQGLEGLAPTKPNFVPTDTRIVVNAPAFRMDLFKDGKLIKTYRVGIGYPEFPLPAGMRRADTIIFNPTWTPPDEPWVKGNFAPGRKVGAGDELNPLGRIKIPIGMPSLIHGGKPIEKIGNFASHGCVGLTNKQVESFAPLLAELGGSPISPDSIHLLLEHKHQSRAIKLPTRVPIDLRYETIVAISGKLRIYRDVYERGTNTLDNAKKVLAVYGVSYDQLSDDEKTDLQTALDDMNRGPGGKPVADSIPPPKKGVAASKLARAKKGKVTYHIKGQTEAMVTIAALQGKGYPEPVAINTGK